MGGAVCLRMLLTTAAVLLPCWFGGGALADKSADFHNVKTSPVVAAYLGKELHKCYTQSPLISVSVWLTLFRVEVEVNTGHSSGGLLNGLLGGLVGGGSKKKNCRQYAEQHTIPGRFTLDEMVHVGRVDNMCGRPIYFRSYGNGSVVTANGQTVWRRDQPIGANILVQLIPHPLWLPDDDHYTDSNILDLLLGLLSRLLGVDLTHLNVLLDLELGNVLGLSKEKPYTFIPPSRHELEQWKHFANAGKKGAPQAGREMKNSIYPGYLSSHDFDQGSIKNANGHDVPVVPLGSGNYQVGNRVVSSNPTKHASNGVIYGRAMDDKPPGLLSGLNLSDNEEDGKLLGLL